VPQEEAQSHPTLGQAVRVTYSLVALCPSTCSRLIHRLSKTYAAWEDAFWRCRMLHRRE